MTEEVPDELRANLRVGLNDDGEVCIGFETEGSFGVAILDPQDAADFAGAVLENALEATKRAASDGNGFAMLKFQLPKALFQQGQAKGEGERLQ